MSRAIPVPTAAHAEEMLGEVRALASTLGESGAIGQVGAPASSRLLTLTTVTAWRKFLDEEFHAVVVSQEWPLVLQAQEFARSGHARELVALDQAWGRLRATLPVELPSLTDASFRVGQHQLNRLLPLRDQRLVPRYLAAIAAGDAHGWHPLVYGVVLGIFALPVRQGLLRYGRQTAAGFFASTPLATSLTEVARDELISETDRTLAAAVSRLLPATPLVVV